MVDELIMLDGMAPCRTTKLNLTFYK